MENPETAMFITDALVTISAPDVLPGDVVVRASLRNRMENKQRLATVVLELKTAEHRNQIIKRAQKWYANTTIPKKEKYKYYITEVPSRNQKRSLSYSDDEVEPKPAKKAADKKRKEDRETSKSNEKKKKDQRRKHHGSPKASTSKKACPKASTPKRARLVPESSGPTTSTPLPSAPRIDPNASIDTLDKLVQKVTSTL